MNYDLETFAEDMSAIKFAQERISALTVGERLGECAKFGPEYARISGYFSEERNGVMYGGPQTLRVARMFVDICEGEGIAGFKTVEYGRDLVMVEKKLRSMRIFKRKQGKKCLSPKTHKAGCMCAGLARFLEKSGIEIDPVKAPVITPVTQGLKAEELRLRKELQS